MAKKVRPVNDFVHLTVRAFTPGGRKPHKLLKRSQMAQVAGITMKGMANEDGRDGRDGRDGGDSAGS